LSNEAFFLPGKELKMTHIEIGLPEESNWPWIVEKHAETAQASLTPKLQRQVTIQVVQDALADQAAKLRSEHGETNQVFVARGADGLLAGYIWVGRVRSGFTGALQAHIFNIFIAEVFRGQRIGTLLMSQAEGWAREHQLSRIGLGVSAFNTAAIELYRKLAYEVETLRMVKDLDPD
jgi:ribosomal protein S18 acetylase RimI-like enzyme